MQGLLVLFSVRRQQQDSCTRTHLLVLHRRRASKHAELDLKRRALEVGLHCVNEEPLHRPRGLRLLM